VTDIELLEKKLDANPYTDRASALLTLPLRTSSVTASRSRALGFP
jgi:hypothetical protein